MSPRSEFSPQTLSVIAALSDRPSEWHHGYELAKETGLKSGTLYPILIRLSDRGLLEAEWQDEPTPGRPRRHLYRLTAAGLAAASVAAEPVVLWVTSAGTRFTGGALGLAVGLGLTLGIGLYLSAPLGPRGTTPVGLWQAANPWLPRPWLTAIVFANWVLLAVPVVLIPIVGLRFPVRGDGRSLAERRFVQCFGTGMLAVVIAVLVMTAGADVTVAVALQSSSASNWLNHGPDLAGTAAYLRDLNAAESEAEYLYLGLGILGTGFIVSFVGAVTVVAAGREQAPPGGRIARADVAGSPGN